MKAAIITCFESNEERADLIYEVCKKKGYDSIILTSDFSHIRKEFRTGVPEHFEAIRTRPYRRNLSVQRMLSHRRFAKDVFLETEKYRPDLIWLMAPANSLIKEADKYKQKYPETKLILDIIDMWPESLPLPITKDLLPFRLWKNIRKNSIRCADLLATECDLYQQTLKEEYDGTMKTLYWSRKPENQISSGLKSEDDKLTLCYIGSINNLIDIDRIVSVVSGIDEAVRVHVIGDGEKCDKFLAALKTTAETVYHGPVRDGKKKAEIFEKCHAGINLYKEGLYIGLTVKCIDYFEHGLPIINNIKGDTWKLVEKYHAGFNISPKSLIKGEEIRSARNSSKEIRKLFERFFSSEAFMRNCSDAIDEVMQ
ncbi:MAG: hypothetical protein IJI44_01875 [Erysipelotrichaceae bacterium]|nr:hypothetical protein [Erysipelotrichaceae bacterium]